MDILCDSRYAFGHGSCCSIGSLVANGATSLDVCVQLSNEGFIELRRGNYNQRDVPRPETMFAHWRTNGCTVHSTRMLLEAHLR